MFSIPLWFTGLWFVAGQFLVSSSRVHGDTRKDPYERATYHLKELAKSLDEIEATHNIIKRSTPDHRHKDVINSLQSVCAKLYPEIQKKEEDEIDDVPQGNPSTSMLPVTSSSPSLLEFTDVSDWPLPPIVLVKAEAERVEDNVKVTLYLLHSLPAFVARVHSLEYEKKIIPGARENVSKVQFLADASWCSEDTSKQAQYVYGFEGEHFEYSGYIDIDLCKFDQVWKKTEENGGSDWQQKDGRVISQRLQLPRYRVLSDPGDTVFIEKGKNPTFDIELNLNHMNRFVFLLTLWDWKKGQHLFDHASIKMARNTDGLVVEMRSEHQSADTRLVRNLKVDILREAVVHNYTVVEDYEREEKVYNEYNALVRVTVLIEDRKLSGVLVFQNIWRISDWYTRSVVRDVNVYRAITMKLPYKSSEFPSNLIQFNNHDIGCDENGNRRYTKHGKSCTVQCYAWGRNIKSIFIIKTHPYRPPIKSVSYVIQGMSGFALHDVGLASDDVAGTYRCMAVTENGTMKTSDIKLYTNLFTNVNHFSVEDLHNGTARVKCSASGFQPLNFTIQSDDKNYQTLERVDNKTGNIRIVETEGDETNLTLWLSTDQLKYPSVHLYCKVNGEHGYDSNSVDLFQHIENQNPYIPKINKNESRVSVLGDTIKVVCSVSGGEDMDVMVSLDSSSEYSRIDHNSENIRDVVTSPTGKNLTLSIPTESLPKDFYRLYCGAVERYHNDWMAVSI